MRSNCQSRGRTRSRSRTHRVLGPHQSLGSCNAGQQHAEGVTKGWGVELASGLAFLDNADAVAHSTLRRPVSQTPCVWVGAWAEAGVCCGCCCLSVCGCCCCSGVSGPALAAVGRSLQRGLLPFLPAFRAPPPRKGPQVSACVRACMHPPQAVLYLIRAASCTSGSTLLLMPPSAAGRRGLSCLGVGGVLVSDTPPHPTPRRPLELRGSTVTASGRGCMSGLPGLALPAATCVAAGGGAVDGFLWRCDSGRCLDGQGGALAAAAVAGTLHSRGRPCALLPPCWFTRHVAGRFWSA